MTYTEKIDRIIESVEEGELELNSWEEEFIDSITFFDELSLSFKQKDIVEDLYEKL